MSYRPTPSAQDNPFFFAYRSTAAAITGTDQPIPFTDVEYADDATISGGVVPSLLSKAYVVGESRTSGVTSEYNLNDIDISENTGEVSEGYQVRNNGAGSVVMDDGCYGTTPLGSQVTMRVVNSSTIDPANSNAYETRLMGVLTS